MQRKSALCWPGQFRIFMYRRIHFILQTGKSLNVDMLANDQTVLCFISSSDFYLQILVVSKFQNVCRIFFFLIKDWV